ncbi:hypothetical protein [Leptospira andrefontaineae]|uniref:Uncharacterized protein n=1 Tax=Leptospira andrefontaineae TaxID=2484976 RepID=A0A4R9H053_9LEPT|nr:hypothetical protein [Leptospira andrefontaineae]TGK37654.1 hypothetical protein EHO65_14145 [Leptospira andrefontaineae]
MTKINIVLIAVFFLTLCKEKPKESNDQYAFPVDYSNSDNVKTYDFEVGENPSLFFFELNSNSYLNLKGSNESHCGSFDFGKKLVTIRKTGTGQELAWNLKYVGKNIFIATDEKQRGFAIQYKYKKSPKIEGRILYSFNFYPLANIVDLKTGSELFTARWNLETLSEIKTLSECEKFILHEATLQKRIDEELKEVSPDMAPP